MSFRDLESAILRELREVAKDKNIKLREIMEWRNSELKPQDGETLYHLPSLGVWCCVKKETKHASDKK